jgi:ectoine hydroxylase-related dioxygenase (phytanoyl-CoA dioxygenase family)
MPRGIRECDDTMGIVAQPVMSAGSVLFFMDGGCSHGAMAWSNPEQRRAVLVKYQSKVRVCRHVRGKTFARSLMLRAVLCAVDRAE